MEVFSLGGPDGRYAFQTTMQGTFGFYDLRPILRTNYSGVQFIGQIEHLPKGSPYGNTINLILDMEFGCYMNVFSISKQAGSYCDSGRNYNSIKTLVDALSVKYGPHFILSGCGKINK